MIVGGHGAVGTLFARALVASGTTSLTLVDRRASPVPVEGIVSIQDDACAPAGATLGAVEASDLVILATPEEVATQAAPKMLSLMRAGSLLVETLSVKSRFAAMLEGVQTRAEVLGVNPMFAPDLGFAGRSVVAVPYSDGTRTNAFLDLVASQGARVVRLDAQEHDRACAALQAATHAAILAFGIALQTAGYDLASAESIMPPPHRTMLALLARILSADPEVYRDIQVANPFAGEMRARLLDAHRALDQAADTDDPSAFHGVIGELRALFGGRDADYAKLCAQIFEVKMPG